MESFKKKLKELSKDNPNNVYIVRCTNYVDNNRYFLKNGKFASNKVFNTVYAFAKNKVSFSKLPKDAIYKASLIEPTERNKKIYNL